MVDREAVLTMINKGGSNAEIAEALKISIRTVSRWRRRIGCGRQAPNPLTDDEKRWAAMMLEDGASYQEVALTLNRDHGAIVRHLPGYHWTKEQTGHYAVMSRSLNQMPGELKCQPKIVAWCRRTEM